MNSVHPITYPLRVQIWHMRVTRRLLARSVRAERVTWPRTDTFAWAWLSSLSNVQSEPGKTVGSGS